MGRFGGAGKWGVGVRRGGKGRVRSVDVDWGAALLSESGECGGCRGDAVLKKKG